jgi:hypothetical protein
MDVLNSIGGNTMAWMLEKETSSPFCDRYVCDCGLVVPEALWNHQIKACNYCLEDITEHIKALEYKTNAWLHK